MFGTNSLKSFIAAGILALGGVLSTSADKAEATTVSAVGDSFNVDYAYETLVATLTWTVTNIVGNRWTFSVLIDNNSPDTDARIVSFGFTTDPSASNITVQGSDWEAAAPNANLGAGYQLLNIDDCIYDGNNCQGGGNEGVTSAATDTVIFSFDYGAGPLTFTDFATRWQSISVTDPNNPNGPPAESLVIGPSVVPLPAAGFLLIGALGGLLALRRRPLL